MSHALSIMPNFFGVADMCETLLSPDGIICVVDFCLTKVEDVSSRNYTAGLENRNTKWLKRVFFMALAEGDRTGADANRRNYLEYKFGNIIALLTWEFHWRFIPYYAWIGCKKECNFSLYRRVVQAATSKEVDASQLSLIKSSVNDDVRENIKYQLRLPSYAYQNYPWRPPYTEKWEDPVPSFETNSSEKFVVWRVDESVSDKVTTFPTTTITVTLQVGSDKIIGELAKRPYGIFLAVESSPIRNHVLELKIAALAAALTADECRELFLTREHVKFRSLLLNRLSPYLSSRTLNWSLIQVGGYFQQNKKNIAWYVYSQPTSHYFSTSLRSRTFCSFPSISSPFPRPACYAMLIEANRPRCTCSSSPRL